MSIQVEVTRPIYEPVQLTLAMGAAVKVVINAENEPLANVFQAALNELPEEVRSTVEVFTADGQLADETFVLRQGETGFEQIPATAETQVQPGDRVIQTGRVSNG